MRGLQTCPRTKKQESVKSSQHARYCTTCVAGRYRIARACWRQNIDGVCAPAPHVMGAVHRLEPFLIFEMENPGGAEDDQEEDFKFLTEVNDMIRLCLWALLVVTANTEHLCSGRDQLWSTVDHGDGVRCQLESLRQHRNLFKLMTNFTIEEFDELASIVCPLIATTARSTRQPHKQQGRPPKLHPQQRLLDALLFLKHSNSFTHEANRWNFARSAVCDDVIFVCECINSACANEIRWPTAVEREELGKAIPEFPGCIGHIDGTVVRIC